MRGVVTNGLQAPPVPFYRPFQRSYSNLGHDHCLGPFHVFKGRKRVWVACLQV